MKRIIFCLICLALFSCDLFRAGTDYDMRLIEAGKGISIVESAPDGSIWGLRTDGSLIHYSETSLQVYNSENSIFDSSFCYAMDLIADNEGNIWIAKGSDLFCFDGVTAAIHNFYSDIVQHNLTVRDIEIDSCGDVWCSPTNYSEGGLAHYNGTDWDLMFVQDTLMLPNFSGSFDFDSKGQIWAAMTGIEDSYFAMYNGSEWISYDADDLGYNPYNVTDLVVLADDRVVGYIDYSLSSYYNPSRPDYMIFSEENLQAELVCMSTNAFLLISRNNSYHAPAQIWHNVSDSALVSLDGKTHISFPDEVSYVYSISNDADGDIWLGSNAGLYKVEF